MNTFCEIESACCYQGQHEKSHLDIQTGRTGAIVWQGEGNTFGRSSVAESERACDEELPRDRERRKTTGYEP